MYQNVEPEVSLHLVVLSLDRFVFVFLHSVNDEPHDQEDQDKAEQRADHCTSNHSIGRICTKVFTYLWMKPFQYLCCCTFFYIFWKTWTHQQSAPRCSMRILLHLWRCSGTPQTETGRCCRFAALHCWLLKKQVDIFKKRINLHINKYIIQTHMLLTFSHHSPSRISLIQSGPRVCRGWAPMLTVAGQSHQVTWRHIAMDSAKRFRGRLWRSRGEWMSSLVVLFYFDKSTYLCDETLSVLFSLWVQFQDTSSHYVYMCAVLMQFFNYLNLWWDFFWINCVSNIFQWLIIPCQLHLITIIML